MRGDEMDHKNYLNGNLNLKPILKITGSVSLVTLLAFSQKGVLQAEEIVMPTTSLLNVDPVNVGYKDTRAIANIAKKILKDHVNLLSELNEVKKDSKKAVYQLEDYIVTVYYDTNSGLGIKDVKLTIETKFTHERKNEQKIYANNDQNNSEIVDGVVNVYNIRIQIKDMDAPLIQFTADGVTIKDTDSFDIRDYFVVEDNVDADVNVMIEGEIEKSGNRLKAGEYQLTVKAQDASGNESSKNFTVTVEKTETFQSSTNYYNKNTDVSGYAGNSVVLNAAYSQLGRHQDCTALVSNSLAAAGVYFHGWPAEYFALGYTVSASEALPGDIIYYADGGSGLAHVAIYAGNGQAIHGGWYGYDTVVYSAYVGSGPVFIRVSK